MEARRLKALYAPADEPSLRDLLQDILTELRYIRQDIRPAAKPETVVKAEGEFWSDAFHFDGNGYPVSRANEFRKNFPTYFTDNPSEADR